MGVEDIAGNNLMDRCAKVLGQETKRYNRGKQR